MELKKGFKQTDLGQFPSDWEITELNSLIEEDRTIRYGIVQPGEFDPNGRFMIRGQDYSFGWADPYSLFRVSSSIEKKYENARVITGDLLLTIVGAGTGHVEEVPSWLDGANITQTTARIPIDRKKVNSTYCKYFLKSVFGWAQVLNYMKGAAQPGLNIGDIRTFQIVLPTSKAEQTAIATALSDMDNLIVGLEKLIEKKKAIKQGAMQELLNGRKRLNGFSGEWVVKSLNEIAWYQEGPGLRNWQFTSEGIKVINVTNLENGYLNLDRTSRYISLYEFEKMYRHFEIDENDIVVASSGNSYAKVAVVRLHDLPLVMNTSVIRFKPLKHTDYRFLLLFLKSSKFKEQIDLLITGGAQPNFGPFHLDRILVKMPPTLDEQKAISVFLTDMDLEIENLEHKHFKLLNLKIGMMQELLTGKTRLV